MGVAIAQRTQWARRVQLSPCTVPPLPVQCQQPQASSSGQQRSSSHRQLDCTGVSAPQSRISPLQLPLQPLPLNTVSPPDRPRSDERSASMQHRSTSTAADAPPVDTCEAPTVQATAAQRKKHFPSASHTPLSAKPRPGNSLRRWLLPPRTQTPLASSARGCEAVADPVICSTSAADGAAPGLDDKLVAGQPDVALPQQQHDGTACSLPAVTAGSTVSPSRMTSAATAGSLARPPDRTPGSQDMSSLHNAADCASDAAERQGDQSAVLASVSGSLATAQNPNVLQETAPPASQTCQESGTQRRRFAVEGRGQPERVVCGVRVIWVSRDSRRCGIAGRLLDAVRWATVSDCTLTMFVLESHYEDV